MLLPCRRASTGTLLLALVAAALFSGSSAYAVDILPVCGNGVLEVGELCDDNNTAPGDCCSPICLPETDSDLDGVCDGRDNCPATWNPMQMDDDLDGIGNACDPCTDTDGDGLCNPNDLCPTVPDPDQLDSDEDGIGDACDPCVDPDHDGLCNPDDECPLDADPLEIDTDGDGIPDVCDPCTLKPGASAERGKLSATRLWEPIGDERVRYKAIIIGLPEGVTFRPVTTGIRLLLQDGTGAVLWDVRLPGGQYDEEERRGWQSNDTKTVFQYRGGEDEPGGIRKVKIKALGNGALKLLLKARNANMLPPTSPPLTFTFVGSPPAATNMYCAQGSFAGGDDTTRCSFLNGGDRLLCK